MNELWYKIGKIPDLTLNKYASLEGSGVDGVLEQHLAFLRQLNRKGILSGLSYHLFYFYLQPGDEALDFPGQRLQIFLMIRGQAAANRNVAALIEASPLAEFFQFEATLEKDEAGNRPEATINNLLARRKIKVPQFNTCCFLTKSETLLPAGIGEGGDYYVIREWEMNENARLYNMCNMMEALGKTALYRVDVYPVERSAALREVLRKPMSILRKRQEDRTLGARKDYEGRDVLSNYEDLVEKFDSEPHFIVNMMVFADEKEDAALILDAAGSEALAKGKYNVATFASSFAPDSFLGDAVQPLENLRDCMVMRKGKQGLIICKEDAVNINLNYLPSLFTLEELAPFFRFPTLYDGEVIQTPKETAPALVDKEGALFLGKDKNKYDVYFPLNLLPKHAFVSGVPGSGKTNTMHHLTSALWKEHGIPFLVLEPAKQEYRALVNDPQMKGLYLFSPNADMSFPLHINPFEMPKGTLVAEHIRRLCSVFEGAFPLEPPMPFLLDTAIEAVYRELGWIPEQVYLGIDADENGNKRRLPTMSMLYKRLEKELRSTDYSAEVRGNLESALKVRIGSLLRREMGDVFDVPRSTFPPEKWLQAPAIIELESMGAGPANFLTLMLCSLIRETLKVDPRREYDSIEATRLAQNQLTFVYTCPDAYESMGKFVIDTSQLAGFLADGTSFHEKCTKFASVDRTAEISFDHSGRYCFTHLETGAKSIGSYTFDGANLNLVKGNKDVRHVIVFEEAHNLIGPESEEQTGADANPKIAATAFVVKMLAEVRALKEGIVIADQLPTVMAQEVLKNTGLKIGLRITSEDDRVLLGGTMAASGLQLEQMATFEIGEALIFYEKLRRPFTMRIKEWWGELDTTDKANMTTPKNDGDLRMALLQTKNPEYQDANLLSVKIIEDKYYYAFIELEKRLEVCKTWYASIHAQKQRLQDMYQYFQKIERGQVVISNEDKDKLYDQQGALSVSYKNALLDKKKAEEVADAVQIAGSYVFALERLKNGRWTRAGIPEAKIAKVAVLQMSIAEQALNLYQMMIQVHQTSAQAENDMKKLSQLHGEIEAYVTRYVARYGAKSIQKQ